MAANKAELTDQEADLYDRQIRLWGLESQKKLRVAEVLLIGVRALGAEIAKNVLLAGIKSMCILDDGIVGENDVLTNFLLPRDCLNKNVAESVLERAQNLNSMVEISADAGKVEEKDESFYKKFTIIIATRLSTEQLIKINQICRKFSIQFLCGDVFGMSGYIFSDLQSHEYCQNVKRQVTNKKRKIGGKVVEKQKIEFETVQVKNTINYVPFEVAMAEDWLTTEQKKINKLSPWFFLTRVLLTFRDARKRNPSYSKKDEDIVKLKEIRDKLFEKLDVTSDKLPDTSLELVFGEIVPICAIVGGVLAQEVIKAVSHNEAPINNMFFLDPNNFNGKIECCAN